MTRLLFILALALTAWPASAAPTDAPPLPRARPKVVEAPAEPRSFAEAAAGLNFNFADVTSAPSACQVALAKIAVVDPVPRLIGPRDCGGGDMVSLRVIFMQDKTPVTINPPIVVRCPMAAAFTDFVRDDLSKILKGPKAVRSIDGTGSYECRGRNRVVGAKTSEHGKGNAVDVHSVKFADGTSLFPTDLMADKDLRETLKAAACQKFSTVLGPGSDGYHEEHVHVDLAERRGDFKMCQWEVRVPGMLAAGSVPLPRSRPTEEERARYQNQDPGSEAEDDDGPG